MTTTTLARPSAPAATRSRRSGSDYAELSRRIKAAGLLDRRPRYYLARSALLLLLIAGTVTAFLLLGQSWWQLLVAVVAAFCYGQVALLAHDLAHRQIFRTRGPSEFFGRIAGNLMIGMSYGWWMDKHTRHHANPNHEDLDPDVAPDILVWSTEQARAKSGRGLATWLARHQGYLFVPLLTLEGLNLHLSGFRATLDKDLRGRGIEALLLTVHVIAYAAVLLLVLSPWQALAFAAVHQGLWGVYMGGMFAPNHKGMPTLRGDERPDYLRRQVLTSRNVVGGHTVNVALGGLNYQIEHHLFPSMPSANLRRARPIVKDYCAEIGVDYCETGLFRSYAEALGHLNEVGRPLRDAS